MFTMDTVSIIKKLSAAQGISLKQLALRLGFGENTIYRWNTKKPTIDKLQKVADYFNVSTDYLLGRTNKKSPDTNEKSVDLSSDDYIMTYQGKPIPPEDMEYIKRILNGGKD